MRNNKIIVAASITASLLLIVSIAFAALASNLNISFGNVTQNALTWNVGFKGSSVTPTQEGTSTTGLYCGNATVTSSTVTISDSTLSKPGDKCTYDLTIQNNGDIAANLSSIAATEPTGTSCTITNNSTMVCGYITYQLQTTSGSALTASIIINKNEEYNIKLVASYTSEELNSTTVTQSNAKFTLTYTQATERSSEAPEGVENSIKPKCKRATTLHTEECDNGGCRSDGYSINGTKGTTTITYGSLGTKGKLTSGDAFDCDVNGDGNYDPETERFYYVSGIDGNRTSDYAALIYYINVIGGVINGKAPYAYYSGNINIWGPSTLLKQLPSMEQWPNVNLSNQTRQIYAQNNTTKTKGGTLKQFTYTDRAARLLSHKEVNAACGITIGNIKSGELASCNYLMENTYYSVYNSSDNFGWWWLESPDSSTADYIWVVTGVSSDVPSYYAGYGAGIRPVIEVALSDIDY